MLAIGAALLGAEAVAIDVDPASAATTVDNAIRNDVVDSVRFDDRTLAALAEEARRLGHRFDVVLANLLSPIVVELAPDLVEVVAPGGHLVVSGLLSNRQQQARAALSVGMALDLVDERSEDGWTVLVLRRPPPVR